MAISKDVYDEDNKVSLEAELPPTDDITSPSNPPKVEPLISLHTFTSFSSPQTLKMIGYINHMKVIILVTESCLHLCIAWLWGLVLGE